MRFSDLPERLREVRDRIDAAVQRGGHQQRVTVVAVTKTHGPEAVDAALKVGLQDVGENLELATGEMLVVVCVGFDELEIASRKQLNQRMISIELIE